VLNAVKGVALQILTPYLLQAVTDRVVDGRMQAFMQMLLLAGGIFVVDAILKDAPILLLDEPTSALDTQSEALVQEALDRFMAGRTALIVAHRLSTIKGADHILVLDQGNICEQGTHAVLMQQGSLYRRLVQKQVTNQESGAAHFVLSKEEQHEQQDR
jgi:ABC-type multidrug transport system ATPase subunit